MTHKKTVGKLVADLYETFMAKYGEHHAALIATTVTVNRITIRLDSKAGSTWKRRLDSVEEKS